MTHQWLQHSLLAMRAEVVGAAWDDKTGSAEVAALIARMTAEKKIETVPGPSPRLRLLVPRESLSDYERLFADQLFVSGDEIDKQTLSTYYQSTGFDPAAVLRAPLRAAASKLVNAPRRLMSAVFIVAGVFCAFIVARATGLPERVSFWVAALWIGALLVSMAIARTYRMTLRGRDRARRIGLPIVVIGAVTAFLMPALPGVVTSLLVMLLLLALTLVVAQWTGNATELDNLRGLFIAREFFRLRLLRGERIENEWIPYIVAFGLGPSLDQWFVTASRDVTSSTNHFFSSSSGSSADGVSSSAFSAGGGSFGGAGASGGWSSTIDGFASSVPSPGTGSGSGGSSDGGGGDSGGGSGGGGGGGW
jgi:uncharacterized membrane protein YgcG